MASLQVEGTERLAAWIDECRAAGNSVDHHDLQQRLLKELLALQERWVSLTTQPVTNGAPRGSSSGSLFQVLMQALLAYSGAPANGTASGSSSGMTIPLISSSVATSECVLLLLCELLAKAYDYSSVPVLNDHFTGKHTSLYVKTALVMVIARLSAQDASQFVPEAVAFAHKHVKTADYYLRQCLVESVARMLQSSGANSSRLKASHGDALKIVGKTFQDKTPDVRVASAGLLHVLATQTSTVSSSSGSSSGAGGSSGNGVANGAASTGGANGPGGVTSGPASGGGGVMNGVSLEAIMQTAYKGMDDASPEARRAFSVVVGVVLAKFVTIGSYHVQSNDAEGLSSPSAVESEGGNSHGKSKSMGFKLLPASLTRRKGGAASADFSSIASVVLYLKDLITSKYLATSLSQSQQNHGGILASYSVALCSMFERLPADLITETQLEDIIYAIVSILDHSLSLPDLTRARNAVCFALRHGVNLALSERQQCALLGVYMQIGRQGVDHEAFNHHKVLVVLVETSHLIQSLGEASVVHANEALQVLHGLLAHEKQSLRFQAAIAMASLLTALPYKLKHCLLDCLHSLRDTSTLLLKDSFDAMDSGDEESSTKSKADLYAVQGYSTAIAHVVRAFVLQQSPSGRGGLSHSILSSIMNLAERLIESQFIDGCADSIWLTCTRAGWTLVSSLVTVRDEHWVHTWLRKLSDMWLRTSILHTREASLELLRVEAAVVAMHSFITSCRDALEKSESLQMLMAHVLHAFLLATRTQLAKPQKRRGQIAKHRLVACLMKCFTALPPVFCDSSIHLLDLITEYTTSQSLTNLTHSSSSHPATTTFLRNALSGADEPLEMVSTGRLVPGDDPNVLYSRELNHILALLQHENALSDIEVEIQYLDTFWGLFCESLGGTRNDLYDRAMCSSFTSVRLVDASVFLFGRVFHHLPEDLQLRCLQHFASVLADGRIDCEVNVCALLFAVLKQGKLSKSTTNLSALSWPSQVQSMLLEMVSSENTTIRRGAGEGLGLLASILPESAARNVVQELEKRLRAAEKLPTGTVMVSGANNSNSNPTTVDSSVLAAGASFALACVKRVCGSGITVDSGLIFRFAGEIEQPLRTWILHAWSIIVDSVSASGGDYEQYVKSSASLIEAHLVAGFKYSNKTNKKWLRWHISSQVSIGRIINGVVATLGPELATSGELLTDFYTLWGLLRQDGYDTRVELEYLKFIEQVVVFAPARFDGSDLVYILSLVSDVFVGPALANDAVSPSSVDFVNVSSPSSELGDAQSGAFGGISYPTKNVLVCVNGLARNILQQVGMSCLRTLAERDPGVIRRYNLQCLLFHALHVEWNSLLWRYVPGLHGMWDLLSFKVYVPCKTRDGLGEIQNTILALIDIDGGNWGSCQPCVWALFCRGIAMGESSSSVASTNENLMMSPKGFEMLPIPGSTTDRDGSGWSAGASQTSGKTGTHIATGAVTAQMDTWRRTKRHVRGLLSLVPLLSRQVRRFAVACVVRVFELVSRGGEVDVKPHFDLVEARARFLESVSIAAATTSDFHAQQLSHQASDGTTLSGLNFLSMYVDEFVTLACHATTSSAEGNELQIFQCDGLRLLKVVLTKFGNAQDPEVTGETAYLLDPYQAQISSAVRHAVKQAQHSSEDHDDDQDFYAPLAVEAFSLCGESVRSRLVQDKVAFGRLLRMVMTKDYGHGQHFAGDEVTRVAISLANLSCLANLVVSSLDAATDATSSSSSLGKALTSNINGAVLDHIIACWLDATACYGLLMEGSGPWPVALLPVSHDHKVVQSSVLKLSMPVSPPQLTSLPPQTSSPTVDALREVFRRFWPAFPLAVVSLLESNAVNAAAFSGKLEMVLSYCVFHVATGARDRQESEIVPVLRAMPRLLKALQRSPQIADFMTSSLAALMFASTHAYGTIRIECLTSLFSCLQSITPLPQATMPFGAQAALCPFQILAQIADPAKHRLSIGGRDDVVFIPEILRFAATGVVFLRGHDAVRASIFDALPMVDRCTEFFVHHPEHMVPFAAVHRGVIESAITLLKVYGNSEEGEYYVEAISNSLGLTAELLQTAVAEEPVVEYQVDAANAVFKLVANVAVPMPPSLSHVATAFHGVVMNCVSRLLTQEIRDMTDTRRDGVIAALIGGVRGVTQRLVENGDASNAQRYLGSLAPISIAIFDSYTRTQGTPIHVDGIREVEQWIRLLSTQLSEIQGAAFVRLMLPKLAAVLSAVETQPHDVKAAVSTSLADLLLCFAQTRPAAFKEVVGAIAPSQRTVLETSLRAALTTGTTATTRGGAVASTGSAGNGVSGSTLDLSRYK